MAIIRPVLAQQFVDKATGAYGRQCCLASLLIRSVRKRRMTLSASTLKNNLISYIISNGLRTKYNALLTQIILSKWMNDKDIADKTALHLSALSKVPYQTIADKALFR